MASLEQRSGRYRVVFRYSGRKFSKSLRTKDETTAKASLARLEDNLGRLELGTLALPKGADVAAFLISDGHVYGKPKNLPIIRTLKQLSDAYLASIPIGSLEESTFVGMRVHIRHLKRLLGSSLAIREIQLGDLQKYIDRRSREKGLRGGNVSPATIKKELVSLRSMWNWTCNGGQLERPLPQKGLRYQKTSEKPPFQTWKEIERQIDRNGLSENEQTELWGCLFLAVEQTDELLAHVQKNANHPAGQRCTAWQHAVFL